MLLSHAFGYVFEIFDAMSIVLEKLCFPSNRITQNRINGPYLKGGLADGYIASFMGILTLPSIWDSVSCNASLELLEL